MIRGWHGWFGTIDGVVVITVLALPAFGFFAPMRFVVSVPRVLATAAGGSILVETLQYLLRLDRVSSVDDVLLNTAGAGLAALASRRWWRTAEAGADAPAPGTNNDQQVGSPD
jgi:glycopeptide antibiotics resistance protein